MLLPFIALGAYENSGKTNASAITVEEIMNQKSSTQGATIAVRKLDTDTKSSSPEWLLPVLLIAAASAAIYFFAFKNP